MNNKYFVNIVRLFEDELHDFIGTPVSTKVLGSGAYGCVFVVNEKKVLKVTSDKSEVRASNLEILRTGELKHIVKIYDVFRFPYISGYSQLYGILEERLSGLGSCHSLRRTINNFIIGRDSKQKIITCYGETLTDDKNLCKLQMSSIFEDLRKAGIDFYDFHDENILKRGKDFVLIDLGGGSKSKGKLPKRIIGEHR